MGKCIWVVIGTIGKRARESSDGQMVDSSRALGSEGYSREKVIILVQLVSHARVTGTKVLESSG